MSMTKKYFEAVADAINDSRQAQILTDEQASTVANLVAIRLDETDNSKFNKQRFLEACGVTDKES
jgi:hypothetical protein